jgi:hypothetical protein
MILPEVTTPEVLARHLGWPKDVCAGSRRPLARVSFRATLWSLPKQTFSKSWSRNDAAHPLQARRNWHYRGTIGPTERRERLGGSCKTGDRDTAARQVAEIEARYWKGCFDGPGSILTFAQAAAHFEAAGKPATIPRADQEIFSGNARQGHYQRRRADDGG